MVAFFELGLATLLAATCGAVARLLRQPVVIGYIGAGILLSLLLTTGLVPIEQIEPRLAEFGRFGVAMLLFLVGLDLDLKKLRHIGLTAVLTGLGQIVATGSIGILLARTLGFELLPSLYIGLALTFSSTVIAVKALQERASLDTYFGRIVIGFLLVQDLAAILTLIVVSNLGTVASLNGLFPILARSFGSALVLLFAGVLIARFILPPLARLFARQLELLFLASLAYALLFSWLSASLNLSLEIGAFLAGVSLSPLPFALEIASKLRPLRDFFLTIFFISLGLSLGLPTVASEPSTWLLLSLVVLIVNPLSVFAILWLLKHRNHTSFHAALPTAQVGEFSFILAQFGLSLGHINESAVSLITATALLTILVSSYLISHAQFFYRLFRPILRRLERKISVPLPPDVSIADHTVLLGYRRIGRHLLGLLRRHKGGIYVVDVNPEVIDELKQKRVTAIFGDATDETVLLRLELHRAKALISTLSSLEDNLTILDHLKALKQKPQIYMTALEINDALKLYERGADYVIIPHEISGEYAKHLLRDLDHRGRLRLRRLHHLRQLRATRP